MDDLCFEIDFFLTFCKCIYSWLSFSGKAIGMCEACQLAHPPPPPNSLNTGAITALKGGGGGENK